MHHDNHRFWFAIGRICFFAPPGWFWTRLWNVWIRHDEVAPARCFYCRAKTTGQPYRISQEYVYPACCIKDECLGQWNFIHVMWTPYDIDAIRDARNEPGIRAGYAYLDAPFPAELKVSR